jgi:hypothetical protein
MGYKCPIMIMRNPHGVDLEETLRNADKEGIDLSEITLFYSDLTKSEELELTRYNLLVTRSDAAVIGRFNAEGVAMFPDKISAVYHLGG